MRKVPSLLLPSASHETVGIIYLPLATTTAPRHRSSNRSGGNTSPVEKKEADQTNQPTNHAAIAGARQSLAIIQTSLGHSALRRAKEERPRGASAAAHDNNSTLR